MTRWRQVLTAIVAKNITELLFVVGILLWVAGWWTTSHPVALGVPGGIIVYITCPTRPRFFEKE